jgi:hypothetical protein
VGISRHEYLFNEVYRAIANRFRKRYEVNISDHIDSMLKIGKRAGQGITFWPVDSLKLKGTLNQSGFTHDKRSDFCQALAAAATTGEGYREAGVPSLHCQISHVSCNIHLDSYGFVAIGPDGQKYYNPDLVQHIADELGWATVVEWLEKRSPTLGRYVGAVRPILPNSRNQYRPAVGAKFVLRKGQGWSLAIDVTTSSSGEKQAMANVQVLDW